MPVHRVDVCASARSRATTVDRYSTRVHLAVGTTRSAARSETGSRARVMCGLAATPLGTARSRNGEASLSHGSRSDSRTRPKARRPHPRCGLDHLMTSPTQPRSRPAARGGCGPTPRDIHSRGGRLRVTDVGNPARCVEGDCVRGRCCWIVAGSSSGDTCGGMRSRSCRPRIGRGRSDWRIWSGWRWRRTWSAPTPTATTHGSAPIMSACGWGMW